MPREKLLQQLPDRLTAEVESLDEGGAWDKAYEGLEDDCDSLELWEGLISQTEALLARNGGNRQVLDVSRSVFDKLLTKYPLLFGYWIKYAQLEQQYGDGNKSIYERAINAFPNSIELWTQYLDLQEDDREKKKMLFKRASFLVGQDFLSHPFWDKYLEFCSQEDQVEVKKVLEIIIHIPLHQYARYYEKYRELNGGEAQETEESQQIFQQTAKKTNERWPFESKITRNYFHVVELEKDQLENWDQYLDYIELNGSNEEISALYERALIPAALYDSLWLRYVRWMMKNNGSKEEEIRNIFRRAAVLLPLSRPLVRYQWSLFEEKLGNIVFARDILEAVGRAMDNDGKFSNDMVAEWVVYKFGLERRTSGDNNSNQFVKSMKQEMEAVTGDDTTKKVPIYVALLAQFLWKSSNNVKAAKKLFEDHYTLGVTSAFYCIRYFLFMSEINHNGINIIYELWRRLMVDAAVPPDTLSYISRTFMEHLQFCHDPKAMDIYMEVDRETNGPLSHRELWKQKLHHQNTKDNIDSIDKRLKLENGHPGVAVEADYEKRDPFSKYIKMMNEYMK